MSDTPAMTRKQRSDAATPIIAEAPCMDCGADITLPRPQNGPVKCAETYWDVQVLHRRRCERCAKAVARRYMTDPARAKRLRELRRDGNGRRP